MLFRSVVLLGGKSSATVDWQSVTIHPGSASGGSVFGEVHIKSGAVNSETSSWISSKRGISIETFGSTPLSMSVNSFGLDSVGTTTIDSASLTATIANTLTLQSTADKIDMIANKGVHISGGLTVKTVGGLRPS